MRHLACLLGAALALALGLAASATASPYADAVSTTPGLADLWRLGETSGTAAADAQGTMTGTWTGTGVQLGVPGALAGDTDAAAALRAGSYLALGTAFAPANDFSAEAWVSPAPSYGSRYVLSMGGTSTGFHLLVTGANLPVFRLNTVSGTVSAQGQSALSLNVWHHLAATVAGTTVTLYVDGRAVATQTAPGAPRPSTIPLVAGRYANGSGSGAWTGSLDELATYSLALSAEQVAAHAAAGVDPVLPHATIASGPAARTDATTATFALTASAAPVAFSCSLDNRAFTACLPALTLTGLANGPHTLRVRTADRWGQAEATPASMTWTVDPTAAPDYDPIPPVSTIVASVPTLTNSSDVTFALSASRTPATFACSLDGARFSACSRALHVGALRDGAHTLLVRATDRFGQVEATPAAFRWTVDSAPPDTWLLVVGPSAQAPQGLAVFGSEPGASFQCQAGTGTWAPCAAPLPVGPGQVQVRAVDGAGNVDPSPAKVVLAPVPPPAPAAAVAFASASATFPVATSGGGSVQCQLDGGPWVACPSTAQLTGLGWGGHAFAARATFAGAGAPALATPPLLWTAVAPVPLVAALQFPVLLTTRQLSQRRPALRFALNVPSAPPRSRSPWCRRG